MLDLRRYSRLTPALRVNARLRADGWIGGDRLPIQRRVSLGGPDLLPGYAFRSFTCAPRGFRDASDPALCDRSVAAQLEVRTRSVSTSAIGCASARASPAASSGSKRRTW